MGVNTARKLKIVRPFRDPRDWVRPTTHFLRDCDKQVVRHIGDFAASLVDIRDAELLERTQEIRLRVAAGAPLCSYDVLVPMFALVNESLRRSLGFVYYDVQLYAGIVLATGAIAEMKTGEGKTIVAALPACLHALNGRGVHVATVNQYLAERDCQELSPVYRRLGFEVGITRADQPQDKKIAYDCDITYGTGYEFGFDFLRDQLSRQCSPRPRLGERFRQSLQGQTPAAVPGMQRGHAMAIVDEVDSVLLDEATTPLIISLAASASTDVIKAYHRARHVADTLNEDVDFTVDARTKSIRLTDDGSSKVHAPPLHPPATGLLRPWSTYVEQSLKACLLLTRDVDYVVRDGKVMIVDQYTGRIFSERSWNDGLHQSVEVKEGLEVTAERRSAARISRQRYFQMYENLCGMTGTATGHEAEFHKFYRLPVVVVPERRPNRRVALPTRVFPSSDDKYKFVATDVKQRAGRGQPVLIGTRTIEESQRVAQQLDQLCIPFQLLNGKQDEAEAELVGRAGMSGSVTIATNMAGRGTDIKLDAGAAEAGGLHVVATEHQESARVDRQLIGRSGRQGDPGSFQFLLSADDVLFTEFAPHLVATIRRQATRDGSTAVAVEQHVKRLQNRIERQRYQLRCDVFRQEEWLGEVLQTLAHS